MTSQIDRRSIRKILVIKLRAIGDVLLSTVVIRNLRLAFPGARIEFLTEPPSREMLKNNAQIDATLIYDRKTMSGIGLIRLVRREEYDLILDLFGNPRTALVTRLSGARYRVGYRFRWRTYAYNTLVTPRGAEVHNTQFNLDALQAIGVDIQDRNVYFGFSPDDEAFVDDIMKKERIAGKFVVGISAGGGWYTKRWALEKFAELADLLVERYRTTIILTWGPGQLPEAERMRSLMHHEAFIPPATTLPQLGALLKRCAVVVSNDSGPMHIAAAVGTPVLGIYGPTNPVLQGPYGGKHVTVRREGLPCLGCNLVSCPIGHPCMKELTTDMVLEGFKRLLEMNRISP